MLLEYSKRLDISQFFFRHYLPSSEFSMSYPFNWLPYHISTQFFGYSDYPILLLLTNNYSMSLCECMMLVCLCLSPFIGTFVWLTEHQLYCVGAWRLHNYSDLWLVHISCSLIEQMFSPYSTLWRKGTIA